MVPPTMASVIEATKAIYTDRAIKSPPEGGNAQRDLWEKSMDAALGGFRFSEYLLDGGAGGFVGAVDEEALGVNPFPGAVVREKGDEIGG